MGTARRLVPEFGNAARPPRGSAPREARMSELDAVFLARIQFAFTISFHIV